METKPANPVKRAYRRYLVEFSASMLLYVALESVSNRLLHTHALQAGTPFQRVAVGLLPVPAVALMLAAIVRCLRRMDEFVRRVQTEALALAGGTTALLAATWGLGESAGLPPLSAWWTYTVFMLGWIIYYPLVRRRYR